MRSVAGPELLLPAGSLETLQTALRYGADAVYFGGRNLSLRAKAKNFALPELLKAVRTAHESGVRAYVTANVFARDADLKEAEIFFRALASAETQERPDAILVADPGMLVTAKRCCPDIPLHLSTQANTTNAEACRFWAAQGVQRIVTARELSLEEIRDLRGAIPETLELECFVHGAMCISYSGKCLLSRAMTGREANRGACAHPCRYQYALVEEKRPGEYYPVEEDAAGTEILASDDLCMLGSVPELLTAGIHSFKVEGRMKNALYVATVARAYRRAIDLAAGVQPQSFAEALPSLLQEVCQTATRDLSTGFYFADPVRYRPDWNQRVFLGVAKAADKEGFFHVEQRNRFALGDTIYAMKPQSVPDEPLVAEEILNAEGMPVREALHPKEVLSVRVTGGMVEEGDVLYRYA